MCGQVEVVCECRFTGNLVNTERESELSAGAVNLSVAVLLCLRLPMWPSLKTEATFR